MNGVADGILTILMQKRNQGQTESNLVVLVRTRYKNKNKDLSIYLSNFVKKHNNGLDIL